MWPDHNNKDIRVADRVLSVFPTTILQRRLEGMEEANRQLEALVHEIAASEPNSTTGTTTEGGFQTKEDLFQRDNPGIAALKPHIFSAVQDYAGLLIRQEVTRPPQKIDFVLWGWAVIYKAGHTQGLHVHPSANVSGVYYVTRAARHFGAGRCGQDLLLRSPAARHHDPASLPGDAASHRAGAGRHVPVSVLAGAFGFGLPGRGDAHLHRLQRQADPGMMRGRARPEAWR